MSTPTPDTPLIWTSRGMLPIASLERTICWQDQTGKVVDGLSADIETLFFIEEYRLDGELVKRSAEGIVRAGVESKTEVASPV